MKIIKMSKSLIVECIGSFLLVAVVVGSGIMGENLSGGNDAIALLANTIATGAILYVIIKSFSKISGGHFNPAVSLIFFLKKEIKKEDFFYFTIVQILGALIGVATVHYIFDLEIIQISTNIRGQEKMFVSEIISTFGLLMTILFVSKNNPDDVALAVALFITAGYWFTSSTAFANPAVTIARVFTDTFTGISPDSVVYFISGQIVGSVIAFAFYKKINTI